MKKEKERKSKKTEERKLYQLLGEAD